MSSSADQEVQDSTESPRDRWSQVLTEVQQEKKSGQTWLQRLGIFWGWAAGIAGAAGLAVVVLLFIVDLFSASQLFTARNLSDWLFWAAALLMVFGLLAPSTADLEKQASQRRQQRGRTVQRRTGVTQRQSQFTQRQTQSTEQQTQEATADRASERLRRRLRRVYDPWRWRFWGSALLAFGLSMLVGLLA